MTTLPDEPSGDPIVDPELEPDLEPEADPDAEPDVRPVDDLDDGREEALATEIPPEPTNS